VGYYQQRQIFASSPVDPQNIWMSSVGGYSEFKQNQPILDDDAITFKVASREINEIRHIVELSELIMLTSTGEWVIKGGQDDVLTPSTITVKRQGYSGSSHLAPLVIDSYAQFLQEKGSQIRTLGYSYVDDSFSGKDMTILSNHLFLGHTIIEWTYQKNPFSCIWAVREDGILLGLTYMPEHDVAAWHWHETPGGLFKSVCCISEDGKDVVYVLVLRNEVLYLEKFGDRYPASNTAGDWLDRGTIAYSSILETLELTPQGGEIREKQKIITKVNALVEEVSTLRVGPDSGSLVDCSTLAEGTSDLMPIAITTRWSKGGRVYIQHDTPAPVTILGLIPEVTLGG
jgi:hypothetical protein